MTALILSAMLVFTRTGGDYTAWTASVVKFSPHEWTALVTKRAARGLDRVEFVLNLQGGSRFVFGGSGTDWNRGTIPAHARLFFSIRPDYNLTAAEGCYWWSRSFVNLPFDGPVTLSEGLNPADWSNALGHSGSDRPEQFARAVRKLRRVGVSFGGGSFYDVGVRGWGWMTVR